MAKTFSELQALALQIRDEILEKKNTAPRVGAALLDMIDNTIQNITDINQKLSVFEHACSGFKRVESESQLPVTPPQDEKAVGYLVGKNLYLYVGKDGNAVNGRYFNVGDITGPKGEIGPQGIKGDKGDKGEQGNSGLSGSTDNIEVVNNLEGGESTPEKIKVLAAEQGKVLNAKFSELGENIIKEETITSDNSSNNLYFFTTQAKTIKKIYVKAIINETNITYLNVVIRTTSGNAYKAAFINRQEFYSVEVDDLGTDYIAGVYLNSSQMTTEIGKALKVQILYGSTQSINPLVEEAIEPLRNTPEKELQQKAKLKGCDRGVSVKTYEELFAINSEEVDRVYYLLDADIYINFDIEQESINLPKKCVFDFNNHTIMMNNRNHHFKSPFDFGDDGLHFDEYPILLYNRDKIERPFYSSNEDWTLNVLSGMFRVNDDVVYLKDWTRGKKINTMLACFCNCKILIDSDFEYTYGQDNDVEFGINSNVEFSCINGAKIILKETEGFGVINKINIVGTNVLIKDLEIENGNSEYRQGVDFVIKCNKKTPQCNVKFIDCRISGVIETLYANDELYYSITMLNNTINQGGITPDERQKACLSLQFAKNCTIRGNKFTNGYYGIVTNSVDSVDICNNYFENMSVVGIILMGAIPIYKQHFLSYCNKNCSISFNTFRNVAEEAVSFDFVNGSVNVVTVEEIISREVSFAGQNVNSNSIRCSLYKEEDAKVYKNGCVLISLHKDRPLNYHFIYDVLYNEDTNDYTFICDLDSFNANVEISDKYIVAKVAFNNKVEHNVFYDVTTALCIYGNAIRNTASYNTIYSSSIYKSSWMMYMMALVGSQEKPLENCYAAPIIDNIYKDNICYENNGLANDISVYTKDISDIDINNQSKMPIWEEATDKFIKGCKIINNTTRGKINVKNAIDIWIFNNLCNSISIINSKNVHLIELTTKDYDVL